MSKRETKKITRHQGCEKCEVLADEARLIALDNIYGIGTADSSRGAHWARVRVEVTAS